MVKMAAAMRRASQRSGVKSLLGMLPPESASGESVRQRVFKSKRSFVTVVGQFEI